MKNTYILAAICSLILSTGCQQAENMDTMDETLRMSIEASIGNIDKSGSRYTSSNNNPNSLTFEKDNSIGVFVDNRPAVQWTLGETNWSTSTSVYWPDKTNPYDFYAYYPYNSETTSKTSVKMPSLSSQEGTIESLSDCDFLIAKASQLSYEDCNGTVSFTDNAAFSHVSSLIAITIQGKSDLKTSTIQKIKFEGEGIAASTTYSFETNQITKTDEAEAPNAIETTNLSYEMKETDHTFYFILNSGIALSNVTFTIEYETGTDNYKASKQGLGSTTLTSGKQYNFNLNITDGVLNITGNEISKWGDGGKMDDIIINTPEKTNEQNE